MLITLKTPVFIGYKNRIIFTALILNKINMKKIILSVVAIFAFGFSNAQEVKFGAKAGLNLSTITGGNLSGGSRVGFHVGGLAEIGLTEKFAVQPELLLSMKGASYDSFGAFGFDVTPAADVNLTYIDLPIMAKYYVIEGLSVEAGPQVGFLMSAKGLTYDDVTDTYDEKGDVKDGYKSIDVAFNIGAGYKLKNGIMFQARYSLGLTDVSEAPSVVDPEDIFTNVDYKEKNNVFQISVGYQF